MAYDGDCIELEFIRAGRNQWHIDDLRALCIDAIDAKRASHSERKAMLMDVERSKRLETIYLSMPHQGTQHSYHYDEVCKNCVRNLLARL